MKPLLDDEAIEYYWDRPVEFIDDNFIYPAREIMQDPDFSLTRHQRDALNEIAKNNRVCIESGHGTGKSTTMAFIGSWFLTTRHNTLGQLTKIPCIAPTFHQLYDILWPEYKRWIPMSRLAPLFHLGAEEIYIKGHKDSSYIRARSPKKPDNVQGFHAAHLLWICDEAFGIADDLVWETIEGSLTEDDNRILIAGQHTSIIGYCHDAFNKDKEFWKNLRFSSEDSPIAKQDYCERIARKYGRNSDVYRVRVLGMAPKGNPESFIQLVDAEAARGRSVDGSGKLYIGVDVARFGDDLTVVTTRHGNHVFPQASLERSDTDDIVDLVIQELRKYRKISGYRGRVDIKIDATGGYGAGVVDALNKNTEDNIRVVPITFGTGGDDEYHDNTSIMWGEFRDRHLPYIQLPSDKDSDFLIEELSARRFKIAARNRVQIEPKAEFKKEYENSPDRSDSLMLCFTEQTERHLVFGAYTGNDSGLRLMLNMDWDAMNVDSSLILISLIATKDFGIYGGFYHWSRKREVLSVYDELVLPYPTADTVASFIRRKAVAPLKSVNNMLAVNHIFANEEMFQGGHDMVKLLRKKRIKPKRNRQFDLAGSIMDVNRMFYEKRIKLHYDLDETNHQYINWEYQNNQPVKGFPLCHALCLVLSSLKDLEELEDKSTPPPYSYQKQKLRESLRDKTKKEAPMPRGEYDYLMK